jgi:hypothetical protein
MGPTHFIRSSQQVAAVLKGMGFRVMQAPGEAEATCAALCTAGLVDGVASFDGDTLLFGAEVVYPVVSLSATQEKNCSVKKCTLAAIRNHLGLSAPGSGRHALALFAALCGGDYDESGAHGIGGVGAMALVKKLLSGCTDDTTILDRFENLLNSEPDPRLASLVQCTGCLQCKHESGHGKRVKVHSAKNPCPYCPPAAPSTGTAWVTGGVESVSKQNHGCIPQSGECQCAFHRRTHDRVAERVAAKARANSDVAQRARESVKVYIREAEEARHAVEHEMGYITPGEKLTWLHRPEVTSVHRAIISLQRENGCTIGGPLDWNLSTLRSKMIPALMEWDLRHPPLHYASNRVVEFQPKIIRKIQGSGVASKTQWRYLVEFERVLGVDIEGFGTRLRPLRGNSEGAGAAADILLSSPTGDERHLNNNNNNDDDLSATQRSRDTAEGIDIGVFDGQWLASNLGKSHRSVRMSLIRDKWPDLEVAFVEKGSRATPAPARRGAGRKEKQSDVASTPERPRNLTKNLLVTPTRHPHQQQQQQQNRCNEPSPLGSIDQYLMRRKVSVEDRIEEEPRVLMSVGGKKKGIAGDHGASGSGQGVYRHRGNRSTHQEQEETEVQIDGDDSSSPSKKHRMSTPADKTKTFLPGSGGTGSDRVVPESENLKTLKSLMKKRRARLLAEAARLEAMTEEERAAQRERTRQRGAELGQLFAAGGSGGQNATTTTTTAPPATTEEEEEEVIDLVTPVSSSASEEEHEEEKERIRTSPRGAPPALPRRSRRHQRQNTEQDQHGEEIVIDLTGD